MKNLNNIDKTLENVEKELRISDVSESKKTLSDLFIKKLDKVRFISYICC